MREETYTEIYAGIYHATCDECGYQDTGWFYIRGTHADHTLCDKCHAPTKEEDTP